MKRKYKCHKCGEENIVNIDDMITMGLGGMGGSGVIATEIGFDRLSSSSNLFGGGFGFPRTTKRRAKEFKHNCKKCNEENIVKID